MKKRITIYLLILVLMTACLGGLASCNNEKTAAAQVNVSMNAEMTITVDDNGNVIYVLPLNEAAEIMLVDMNLLNIKWQLAMEKLVVLAANMGYINDQNNAIYIETFSINEEEEKKINRKIFDIVKGVDNTFKVKTRDYRLEEKQYRSFIRRHSGYENMTFMQYRLVDDLSKLDSDINLADCYNMSIDELTIELRNSYEKSKSYGSLTLADKAAKAIDNEQENIAANIATAIGGDYYEIYSGYIDYSDELVKIYEEKENTPLKDEDIKWICEMLEIPYDEIEVYLPLMANSKGMVTMASLRNYIDELYLSKVFVWNDRLEYEKKIDIIEDKFGGVYSALSEEQIARLTPYIEIISEDASAEKITNVADAYKLTEKFTVLIKSEYDKAKTALTGEFLEQIEAYEREYWGTENRIKDEMREEIDNERARLRKEKDDRLFKYTAGV